MSDGSWRSHAAIRVIAIVVGAVVSLTIVVIGKSPNGPESEYEYQYTQQYNGDARTWAPTPFNQSPLAKDYHSNCQNPKDHDEADLCQQWRAANAAEKAADAAMHQIYWNWVQAVVAVFTGIAAWAAAKSVRISNQALRGLERPYVYLNVIDDNFDEAFSSYTYISLHPAAAPPTKIKPAVGFVFKNFGRSPAVLKIPYVRLELLPCGAEPDVALAGWDTGPVAMSALQIMLGAGEETKSRRAPLVADFTVDEITKQEKIIWLVASCLYQDGLGICRKVRIQYSYVALPSWRSFRMRKYEDVEYDGAIPEMFR